MYHSIRLVLALFALWGVGCYVVGRLHGRRALQRQLRGDVQ